MQQAIRRTLPLARAFEPATRQDHPLASASAGHCVQPSCAPARYPPPRPPSARPHALLALLPPAADAPIAHLGSLSRDTRANDGSLLEWLDLDQPLDHSFNDVNADILLAGPGWRLAFVRFVISVPSIPAWTDMQAKSTWPHSRSSPAMRSRT